MTTLTEKIAFFDDSYISPRPKANTAFNRLEDGPGVRYSTLMDVDQPFDFAAFGPRWWPVTPKEPLL